MFKTWACPRLVFICPVTDDVEDLDMLLGPGSNICGRPRL